MDRLLLDRALILTVCNIGLVLVNLVVFGLSLKLYTEYFKDRSQSGRR